MRGREREREREKEMNDLAFLVALGSVVQEGDGPVDEVEEEHEEGDDGAGEVRRQLRGRTHVETPVQRRRPWKREGGNAIIPMLVISSEPSSY